MYTVQVNGPLVMSFYWLWYCTVHVHTYFSVTSLYMYMYPLNLITGDVHQNACYESSTLPQSHHCRCALQVDGWGCLEVGGRPLEGVGLLLSTAYVMSSEQTVLQW